MADDLRPTLIDTVQFCVIGGYADSWEYRCWSDGDTIHWRQEWPDGKIKAKGTIPRAIFALAAVALAKRCEREVFEDGDPGDNAYNEVHDRGLVPIEYAMAHPHNDNDDEEMNGRLGFASCCETTTLGGPSIGPDPRKVLETPTPRPEGAPDAE